MVKATVIISIVISCILTISNNLNCFQDNVKEKSIFEWDTCVFNKRWRAVYTFRIGEREKYFKSTFKADKNLTLLPEYIGKEEYSDILFLDAKGEGGKEISYVPKPRNEYEWILLQKPFKYMSFKWKLKESKIYPTIIFEGTAWEIKLRSTGVVDTVASNLFSNQLLEIIECQSDFLIVCSKEREFIVYADASLSFKEYNFNSNPFFIVDYIKQYIQDKNLNKLIIED